MSPTAPRGGAASKVRSFLAKSNKDRLNAVQATIRHACRDGIAGLKKAQLRRITAGELAVPRVLHSKSHFYQAYRPDSDIDFDRHPEMRGLSGNWVANNVANNACDLPRFYALAFNIKQVLEDGVAGDFAELGVYRGNSAAVLAHYGRKYGRTTYLFDTFAGFEARDLVGVDATKQREFADTSLALVKGNVGEASVEYVAGYFPDSVNEAVARRRFAVVHLDCDLYEPIKAGLEFFFDRLSPGGLLIIHDYANPCWVGVKQAVDEFLPKISETLILIPDKSGTAMLRKRR